MPRHAEAREHAFRSAFRGEADSFPSENAPLGLFLDLVNDHSARLIVRERLRVITVARMHPNAGRLRSRHGGHASSIALVSKAPPKPRPINSGNKPK